MRRAAIMACRCSWYWRMSTSPTVEVCEVSVSLLLYGSLPFCSIACMAATVFFVDAEFSSSELRLRSASQANVDANIMMMEIMSGVLSDSSALSLAGELDKSFIGSPSREDGDTDPIIGMPIRGLIRRSPERMLRFISVKEIKTTLAKNEETCK